VLEGGLVEVGARGILCKLSVRTTLVLLESGLWGSLRKRFIETEASLDCQFEQNGKNFLDSRHAQHKQSVHEVLLCSTDVGLKWGTVILG